MSTQTSRAIKVSHLQPAQIDSIATFYHQVVAPRLTPTRDAAVGKIADAPANLLVPVSVRWYGVPTYVRAAPGAKPLVDAIGKGAIQGFGSLVSVGLQAYEDSGRSDLTGSQKLGRASLTLGLSAVSVLVPPLGVLLLGASIVFPDQYDTALSWAFTAHDPLVNGMANVITSVGGSTFQQWSTQPSLIDLF